jgi:RimJ/RimL family protein N-acetyltransferase
VASGEHALRPWHPDDADTLAQLLTSESLWSRLPEDYPGDVDPELARDLIAVSNGAPDRHEVRAALWHGVPVGQVRLQFDSSPYADSAEISYGLGEPFWGRGIATDLVTLATARAFEARAGLARLFAGVLEGNVASLRVLEKSGYRHESFRAGQVAKHGRRLGVYTLSVCREDYAFERSVARQAAAAPLVRTASCTLLCSDVRQMATVFQGLV